MKLIAGVLLLFSCLNLVSQKTNVLHQSSYRHDYLVQDLRCIEDLNDTSRIKYMATLQMTDDRKTMYTGEWYGLIKIKAKELGADTYIIEQAQVSNTVSVLQFKLFFAGEKFRNANKEKREKNTVHVFKETNSDSAFFYLNNEKILFGKKASYSFPAKKGDYYHIEAAAGKRGGKRLSFPLEKPSGFYLIRTGYVYPGVQVSPEMTPFSAAGAVSVNGLTLRFSPKESVFEFDYDYGKFLKEIYK